MIKHQIKLIIISLRIETVLCRILTLTKKKTTAITSQPLNRTYKLIMNEAKENKHYDFIKVSYNDLDIRK